MTLVERLRRHREWCLVNGCSDDGHFDAAHDGEELSGEAADRISELEDALNAADRFLPRYVQAGVFGLPEDNEDFRAMAKVYKALGRYVPRSAAAITGNSQ